jgi:hypothetical protein
MKFKDYITENKAEKAIRDEINSTLYDVQMRGKKGTTYDSSVNISMIRGVSEPELKKAAQAMVKKGEIKSFKWPWIEIG